MRLVILGLYLGLISAAWAQNTAPELVTPKDTISLVAGQAQKLNFPQPFDRIDLTSATIVEAKAITDHVMTLHGLAAGETIMTVFAGAKELYSATIIVDAERAILSKSTAPGKTKT
jgi:Flp pilus assembly secretin CpaC